mmetsp:Transcript_159190/g.510625  ORF Transcript_159190/g.510625 Transcript_159190/m.510625 type:complete len:353 (+) Transcript_159190:29-1087(+)
MAQWSQVSCDRSLRDAAFDATTEDFATYARRCMAHMAVDFRHTCGAFNQEYMDDFLRAWCKRDCEGIGLLPFTDLLELAADLATKYESWEVDAGEEERIRAALDHGCLVSLRQLCLYAERDEVYALGPEGQETVQRVLPAHLQDAIVAPPRLAPAFASEEEFGLSHLCLDFGIDPEDVEWHVSGGGKWNAQSRWYAEAWRRRCLGRQMLALGWPDVEDLLREAVEVNGYSRFSRNVCRWGSCSSAEAAALLGVFDRCALVSFRDLCVIAEAPEPFRRNGSFMKSVTSSAIRWSVQFHTEVVVPFFPTSRFRRQVSFLAFAGSAGGHRLPRRVWRLVFGFLARDLSPQAECMS